MAQLKNELAEKELIKKFRHEHTWLARIKSKNQWVSNDVIKIPRRGAAPTVLIDNTIYPIVSDNREDDFIIVALHKYETTNTYVSDDELETLPYEKINDVQVQHREELEDVSSEHSLFMISPAVESNDTPVLPTTGANDGSGRKRLQSADLILMKKKLDDLGVPRKGRLLILCSDHVSDLLLEDLTFKNSYQNIKDGLINPSYMGFETYEDMMPVSYAPDAGNGNKLTKEAFGATPTGYPASIIGSLSVLTKATGSVKRYMTKAENDTANRRNSIGFSLYHICTAIKDKGIAAIASVAAGG